MDISLKVGLNCVLKREVKEEDTALYIGSGNLEVLGTPVLITFMENACKNCVDLHLKKEDTTVGTEINVKHLRATKIGEKITVCSTLQSVNDRKLIFKIESYDDCGLIAEGTHTRVIVNKEKFMNKLTVKEGMKYENRY